MLLCFLCLPGTSEKIGIGRRPLDRGTVAVKVSLESVRECATVEIDKSYLAVVQGQRDQRLGRAGVERRDVVSVDLVPQRVLVHHLERVRVPHFELLVHSTRKKHTLIN